MAVKDCAHAIAIDRFLEPRRAEKGDDLRRFALDRCLDRRVVQDGDLLRRAQPRQRGLELQRFLDRLMHEFLDDLLAPRAKRAPPEAAPEALHTGESDALN